VFGQKPESQLVRADHRVDEQVLRLCQFSLRLNELAEQQVKLVDVRADHNSFLHRSQRHDDAEKLVEIDPLSAHASLSSIGSLTTRPSRLAST
jgi:hypothetical protein